MLLPVLNTLFFPMMLTKLHIYSLDRLKRETCSFLNKLYNVDTFDCKDYAIKINLFGGYQFYNKKTNKVIASSYKMKVNSIKVNIDALGAVTAVAIPDTFKVSESVYFIHNKGKVDKVSHKITVSPSTPNRSDEEEDIYKDIIIQRDKNYNVTSLMVETYDFTFMHGNRLDLKKYPLTYDIQTLILEQSN